MHKENNSPWPSRQLLMTVQKAQIVQFEELTSILCVSCAFIQIILYKMIQEQNKKKAYIFVKLNFTLSFTMYHQVRHLAQIHYARRGLKYTCCSRVALNIAF